jgi:D-beta-D-heptose 7-phosphate kinase / D-beta-D-heptose 1-phosphate adenosyltransferase
VQERVIQGDRKHMFDFDEAFKLIDQQSVLCVGDLILDEFVYGDVRRISPEAPTSVLSVRRKEIAIGGAGNVARNIATLGARCFFVGLIGNDEAGLVLSNAFSKFNGGIVPNLVVDGARQTTRKVRFVSERYSSHLMRADWETTEPISTQSESALIACAEAAIAQVGAVVLSDYAKGVLTRRVIRAVIDGAKRAGKPILVDPKSPDYNVYRGATLITPNLKELAAAARRPLVTDAEIVTAAADLSHALGCEAVLVKRSERGMTLQIPRQPPIHIPGYPVKVRDVSGAGDTVAAVMAVLLAMHVPFDAAMRAANAAAAVVVGKRGTATVSVAELRHRILPAASLASEDKIVFDWSVLNELLPEWQRQGLRVGFTNGCFDLLHRGHVRLLTEARTACDFLIVGLNSDASARRLKGQGRPINPAEGRAELLAALEAVDLVVVFEQDTPVDLIELVRPNVLVKGADYNRDEVVGHDLVEARGGQVILVNLVPGHSTSNIVRRVAEPVWRSGGAAS